MYQISDQLHLKGALFLHKTDEVSTKLDRNYLAAKKYSVHFLKKNKEI